jgi:tetratricopeptide (TPR) repeat protein
MISRRSSAIYSGERVGRLGVAGDLVTPWPRCGRLDSVCLAGGECLRSRIRWTGNGGLVTRTMSQAAKLLKQALEQRGAGKPAEAIALCERAIKVEPGNFPALSLAALIEHERGRNEQALAWAKRAVKAGPSHPAVHTTAGTVLLALERFDEAAAAFSKALSLQPNLPGIHAQLARALHKAGRLEEAVASYRIAMTQNPDARLCENMAAALEQLCEYPQAEELARRALAMEPQSAGALNNLGNALLGQARVGDAVQAYDRAIGTQPDHAGARYNRSLALLAGGDFTRGWAEYESRWQWPGFPNKRPGFPQPAWDGSDPRGRTILVYGEQGIGDVIHFIRYVPLLAARGARVVLACPVELHELLRGMDGVECLIVDGQPLPAFDSHVALMSLPWLFKTTMQDVPNNVPYLRVPPAGRFPIDAAPAGELKVGIVWSGGDRYPKNRIRSIPFEQFLPLLRPGIRFYSLQCGPRAADLKTLPPGAHFEDIGSRLRDYADTAAVIGQLDLVISVCTSVLHLAGALGRPVWGLLSYAPCWRWMLGRDDSPWYPTLRLFRQASPGDWADVLVRADEALRQFPTPTGSILTLPLERRL